MYSASDVADLLDPPPESLILPAPGEAPSLIIVVDAEEEFDWRSLSRGETRVEAMRAQEPAQRLLERYGIVPTYVVDYPVATQEVGFAQLREWLSAKRCEVGAQLHPWVNPPHVEDVNNRNSYAGNLPVHLEANKLRVLTEAIEANLGVRPVVYRAGRYGIGPSTPRLLADLGYLVDTSVVPTLDMRRSDGPDFSRAPALPYWIGTTRRILEVPATCEFYGALWQRGRGIYPMLARPAGERLNAPGIFARLGLLNRVKLTPEGVPVREAIALTRALIARGQRIFVVSYHSPSLKPGNTPYVRTEDDLDSFMGWLKTYLDFFFGDAGGVPTTPTELHRRLSAAAVA